MGLIPFVESRIGIQNWDLSPSLYRAKNDIIYSMKKARNSQQKQKQQQQWQQLSNSTASRSRDSSILYDGAGEVVSKKEKTKRKRKERILLVDDEPDITYTLSRVLEGNGFSEVDAYNEPLLVLQNFKSCLYSLLITDIAMPGINGFELYEYIKRIDSKIKVIFMTASRINYEALNELLPIDQFGTSYESKEKIESHKMQQRGRDEGEERPCILSKPLDIEEFIQRVNNELDNQISMY